MHTKRLAGLQILWYTPSFFPFCLFLIYFCSQDGRCAKVILRLFHLEPNFTWQQYEQFHAYWEVLYRYDYRGNIQINFYTTIRILFSDGPNNTCTITELYQRPLAEGNPNQKKKSPDPSFTLSNKRVILLAWPTDFPQTLPSPPKSKQSDDKPKPTPEELKKLDCEMLEQIELAKHPFSTADLSESVILPASGNPGCDIVFFEAGQTKSTYCHHYYAAY
jgi:hypothetical protein